MKKISSLFLILVIIFALLIGCSNNTLNAKEAQNMNTTEKKSSVKTITDMAGRTMEVPTEITKVYCSGQLGIVMMQNINLDKLLGWGFELRDYEKNI